MITDFTQSKRGSFSERGLAELIVFLESTFDITLEEKHLFGDEFTTINGISEIVVACLEQRPSENDGEE